MSSVGQCCKIRWRCHEGLSHADVRCLQFVITVEALLSSIRPELVMAQPVTRIVLLFGPSPNRPSEIYDILLHADQQAESVPGATVNRLALWTFQVSWRLILFYRAEYGALTDAAALLNTLTRSLVTAAADLPEGPVSKGKTVSYDHCGSVRTPSVGAEGRRQQLLPFAHAGPTTLHMLVLLPESTATDETATLHGFIAKRGFALKQRRGQHVHLNLGCVEMAAAPVVAGHAGASEGSAAQCTWYQAEAAPRGLSRGIAKEQ